MRRPSSRRVRYHLYLLRCADGTLFVGCTADNLDRCLALHNGGAISSYTIGRRPVSLAYSRAYATVGEALAAERRVKAWRREKKEGLVAGRFALEGRARDRRAGVAPRP